MGILGQPLAFPGPQFAQPQKEPGGGFLGDYAGPLGSWVPKRNSQPARPRLYKRSRLLPLRQRRSGVGVGEGRAGRLFSRLSEFPHPTADSWAGQGPGPGRWGPAGRSRKGPRGPGGAEVGSGEALAQPTFFFPCPFLPLPPRPWERSGEGRGRGSRGQRGEQPAPGRPLPAAHSGCPGGGLAGATSRLRGFGPQFPLPHSHGERGLTPATAAVC